MERCLMCGQTISADAAPICPTCLIQVGLDTRVSEEGSEASLLQFLRTLNVIGEGPRGRVYLAEWTTPEHGMVALKCSTGQVNARERRLALLDHPSIATIHEVGMSSTIGAYVIEDYVPGLPLPRSCARAHLSTPDRIELWLQTADAIAYAHARGLPHLNLKPSNVLVVTGTVQILDFDSALPATLPLEPTPYRAPEQNSSASPDVRTDVFTLGVLLDELVAGQEDAPLIQAIARHAMRPSPAERPQSVAASAANVRRALSEIQPV